jgi:arabinan endo-1,5-alpha-L-arabinosidase
MAEGGGTVIAQGNDRWVGPGGQSGLSGPGSNIMVFHAYDRQSETPSLQISTIVWTGGWPELALGR